jgi:hypothetical protein
MLKFDAKRTFDAIPEAQRCEWAKHEASLDQICPAARHETSANRRALFELLRAWEQAAGLAAAEL